MYNKFISDFIGMFQTCKLNIYWQIRAFTRKTFLETEFLRSNCKLEKSLIST